MKKIILTCALFCTFTSQADQLTSFENIAKAVSKGGRISFVINLKECSSQNPPPVIASITPNAVLLINNNRITASDTHFTMGNPAYPDTPVYDFTKYNINSDGSASIKTTTLNAITYEQLASVQINCPLNTGLSVFE